MKKILIVDDDITLRAALSRYLQNRGYLVLDAKSGAAALALIEQDPPDVVVSDVMMPEMDGLEFCRRFRAMRSGQLVPFIFLSSRGEVDARVQGHQMGADDYLVKPFEPKELVAKIEAQLERSRRLHSEIVRLMQQSSEAAPTPVPAPLPFTPSRRKSFLGSDPGFYQQANWRSPLRQSPHRANSPQQHSQQASARKSIAVDSFRLRAGSPSPGCGERRSLGSRDVQLYR